MISIWPECCRYQQETFLKMSWGSHQNSLAAAVTRYVIYGFFIASRPIRKLLSLILSLYIALIPTNYWPILFFYSYSTLHFNQILINILCLQSNTAIDKGIAVVCTYMVYQSSSRRVRCLTNQNNLLMVCSAKSDETFASSWLLQQHFSNAKLNTIQLA